MVEVDLENNFYIVFGRFGWVDVLSGFIFSEDVYVCGFWCGRCSRVRLGIDRYEGGVEFVILVLVFWSGERCVFEECSF